MSGCIKFNKFNIYFKYILLTTFFNLFNVILIGINHNNAFERVSFNDFLYDRLDSKKDFDLSNFKITELLWNFIGIFIFSIFFRLYELKISGNKINDFFQNNNKFLVKTQKKTPNNKEKIEEKEANILLKFKNYLINNSSIFLYIIFALFWVAKDILMIMFYAFLKDLDFWFFEILIVTIFFSNIFLVQVYKHQKLAIIINLFPCFFKITNIILGFLSEEELLYTQFPWWIPVGFICYLILISINSFINCTIKSFIDLKYTTIGQLLIFYSFVGTIICFLTCIISTYIPCGERENKNIIHEKICQLEDDKYTYFDNFLIYFNCFSNEDSSGNFIRAFIIILDVITFFVKEYFYILVIKFMDPIHVIFSQPLFFILKKIILVINNLIINKNFFKDTSNSKPARFFLDIGGDFVCLIGFFIYLEIIELKIFNINYDLRRNISDRGVVDDIAHLKMNESFVLTDEGDDEDADSRYRSNRSNSNTSSELTSYKSENNI